MKIKTFFNDHFKHFSLYDSQRSIPSIVDGLKPSQRKCIYGMLSRGESAGEIKVAQAGSMIAQVSDYHHGEGSLEGTIVGMAQEFSGSNNINLFVPEGQFGSRLSPQSAASRYIFTKMHENFRMLFRKDDDCILNYLDSDGQKIEPEYYYPILPMVLVNGSSGVGTGYSSKILNYNPAEIKKNIQQYLQGKKMKPMVPWYKGFNGTIEKTEEGQTIITGDFEIVNTTTIKVTELPIGMYLDKYKTVLNQLMDKNLIKDYDDNSTEEGFEFIIKCPRDFTQQSRSQLLTKLKLVSKDTENFTLWTEEHKMKVFNNPLEVLQHFIDHRLMRYEERRLKQIEIVENEIEVLTERQRFIKFYIDNHTDFAKKKKDQLFKMLEKNDFHPDRIDNLLSMPIYALTKDRIDALKAKIKERKDHLKYLKSITDTELYQNELKEIKL